MASAIKGRATVQTTAARKEQRKALLLNIIGGASIKNSISLYAPILKNRNHSLKKSFDGTAKEGSLLPFCAKW
jgi:hypothetical protein